MSLRNVMSSSALCCAVGLVVIGVVGVGRASATCGDVTNPFSGITENGSGGFLGSATVTCVDGSINSPIAAVSNGIQNHGGPTMFNSTDLFNPTTPIPGYVDLNFQSMTTPEGFTGSAVVSEFKQQVAIVNEQSFGPNDTTSYQGFGASRTNFMVQNTGSNPANVKVTYMGTAEIIGPEDNGSGGTDVSTGFSIHDADDPNNLQELLAGFGFFGQFGTNTSTSGFYGSGIVTQNTGGNLVATVNETFSQNFDSINPGETKSYTGIFDAGTFAQVQGPDGFFTYDSFNTHVYTISSDNPDVVFTVVPEPASAALLGIGLAAMRRRRRV